MATIFTTKGPLDISFSVCVKGRWQTVKFTPAALFGVKAESLYVAEDELASAMKKHHWFGIHFFVKEEGTATADVTADATMAIEDELRDPETAVYDETVTTKGMAVAYIQGHYDGVFTTTTVEEMKREAARKWNVIFKNWGR